MAVGFREQHVDHWQFFNWPEILREARMRHEQAVTSTASAVTPEMRTLEYWTAWCAHANVASCLSAPVIE